MIRQASNCIYKLQGVVIAKVACFDPVIYIYLHQFLANGYIYIIIVYIYLKPVSHVAHFPIATFV